MCIFMRKEKLWIFSFSCFTFCMEDEISCKPYRRMLNFFISAMHNKVQSAEKNESRNLSKLQNILKEAQKLKLDAESYFKEKLEEQ